MSAPPDPEKARRETLSGLNPDEIEQLLEQLADERMKLRSRARSPEYKGKLLAAYRSLTTAYAFSPGDLVQWKQDLKNKRRPDYGVPCVVVEVLKSPVLDPEQGAGSAYFREPLDLAIGLLDDDDELAVIHVDSRRFEPFAVE